MPPLAANTVVSTAVTDLVNALVILPLLLHMRHFQPKDRPETRLWQKIMGLIALGSLLGFILHIYPWTNLPLVCIWIILYAVLFEGLHTFLQLAIYTVSGGDHPRKQERLFLRGTEAVMLSALVIFLLLHRNPIRLFLLFAVVLAGYAFSFYIHLALRGHRGSRFLLAALLPQIPGLTLQFMRRSEFALWNLDFNGIYHLCILASIVIFYFAARNWNK